MKKLYILSLTALLMAACAEEVTEKGNNGDFITFNVTENNLLPEPTVSTAAAEVPSFFNQTTPQTIVTAPIVSTPEPVKVKTNIELDEPLYMTTTIEKGIQMSNNHNTMRGSLIDENQTIKTITFGVTEFPAGSNTAVTGFNNPKSFSATSNESTAQPVSTGLTWESNATTQGYDFYAYAPYLSSSNYGLSLTDNNKSISYNSKAAGLTIANQQDLMTAVAENVNYTTSGVNLTFNHRLTAVKIVLSDTWSTYKITSVKFSSIYYKGIVAIGTGAWTLNSTSDKGEYEITGTFDTSNQEIAAYLMMIPQTLNTDMIITFKDGNNQTITFEVPLTTTWSPGATVTYTIGAQGITTFQAVYPNGTNAWGGNTQGPVSAYQLTTANGNEAFGMYVADTDGNLVYSNIKMNVTSVSGYNATLSVASDPGYFFSKNYRYFLYYPYKSTYTSSDVTPKSGSTPVTDADTFLGNIASGWSVESDQSASDNSMLRTSDLQFCTASVTGNLSPSFSMKHKMGLIGITMAATHTVYDVIYYDGYTYNSTTHSWTEKSRSATSKTWTPSTNFSSTAVPYQIAGTTNLLYIAKPNENNTFNAVIDETNRKYEWYKSGCTVTAANQYVHYDVDSDADYASACWDFEHSNGVVGTWCPLTSGTYEMECWGSQGYNQGTQNNTDVGGGYGGYTYGKVYLNAFEEVYVTVGGNNTNGGGSAGKSGAKGGGASDIRYKGKTMYDRIMVAAGGGGEERWSSIHYGGYGGGIQGGIGLALNNLEIGYTTTNPIVRASGSVTGGNQIAGGKDNTGWRNRGSDGTFGYGGTGGAVGTSVGAWGGGGGGGYWGGAGGGETGPDTTGGGGGSSFISGHPGCIAIAATGSTSPKGGSSTTSNLTVDRATHFTGLFFTETKMIDGAGYNCKANAAGTNIIRTSERMPSPSSDTNYASGRGHEGLGHVRIWFNKP